MLSQSLSLSFWFISQSMFQTLTWEHDWKTDWKYKWTKLVSSLRWLGSVLVGQRHLKGAQSREDFFTSERLLQSRVLQVNPRGTSSWGWPRPCSKAYTCNLHANALESSGMSRKLLLGKGMRGHTCGTIGSTKSWLQMTLNKEASTSPWKY